jgi:hypothetical protein
MTDEERRRGRPQYGEYATPEEQRAAIKQPADWQLEGLDTDASAEQPVPGAYHPGAPHGSGAAAPPPAQQPGPPPAPYRWPQEESRPPQQVSRPGFGDRLVTFVLLGFGLSNVWTTVADAFDGGARTRESLAVMGSEAAHIVDALPNWLWQGQAIIYGVVWLITLVVSISAMRAGRRSWWIPLVGAFVAFILFAAIFIIAVGENPELMQLVPSPTSTPGATGSST